MKKYILLLLFSTIMFGCANFLDESPNKNGNNYIRTLDDLDHLLQNSTHLFGGINKQIWEDIMTASDDFGLGTDPRQFYKDWSFDSDLHKRYVWDEISFDRNRTSSFSEIFQELSTFNTILERIDNVASNNELFKKQIKGEAKFYRAYYHFLAVVAHCQHPKLNNGENLGIPYRENTDALNVPSSRGTVKQTMDRIYTDLSEAEVLLREAGGKNFDIKENFRITLTNLKAFEARLRLYDGDYEGADKAAKLALADYSALNDYNDAKYDYNLAAKYDIYKYVDDDPAKAKIGSLPVVYSNALINTESLDLGPLFEDPECFIPHSSIAGVRDLLPLSDELYDLYENDDLRKKVHLTNNFNLGRIGQWYNNAPYTKQFSSYVKYWAGSSYNYIYVNIGITVPEIMLIRAECASRGFGDGNAQQILKTLRAKRFPDTHIDMIGGTTADVLAERRREMPLTVRWYDLKRLNALENANITVVRNAPIDGDSEKSLNTYSLQPNAGFYALPLPLNDLDLLGWKQNTYEGVVKQ